MNVYFRCTGTLTLCLPVSGCPLLRDPTSATTTSCMDLLRQTWSASILHHQTWIRPAPRRTGPGILLPGQSSTLEPRRATESSPTSTPVTTAAGTPDPTHHPPDPALPVQPSPVQTRTRSSSSIQSNYKYI